jgi:hypothetical protein
MYHNIVHKEVQFPKYMSPQAIILIKGLLCKVPDKRLGAKAGFSEVKKAEFCKGIDWE